jgi:hypothetical protein
LAEIVGSEKIDGNGRISLEVPVDQVDDILKSLIVLDPKGTVSGVTLGGPSATQEAFKKLPFSADDLGDVSRFANALQGVKVSVSKLSDPPIEGEVLGVAESKGRDGETIKTLSLLADGSVRTVTLTDGVSLRIVDPVMRQKVENAVAAVRKSKTDGARSVQIGISGNSTRDVGISYVVPSSVWKTTFRIVSDAPSGKARIQGWAVVENTTGAEWKDVSLSLTSGAPIALKQRLHDHYWKTRREIPVVEGEVAVGRPQPPMPKRSIAARENTAQLQRLVPQAAGVAMMAAPVADMAAPEERIEASQGDVHVSYAIPHPVTLSSGETMSLPIIDAEIKAERISLYRLGSGSHPQAAIRITNTSGATLPSGIMTIYDKKDGYAGDANIAALRVGGSNILTFASDSKVDVVGSEKPAATRMSVAISDGVLKSSEVSSIEREYRIKGAPDSDRVVMIEHPERQGWTTKSDADVERVGAANYLTKKVPAGRDVVIKVSDEITNVSSMRLIDADDATLKLWSTETKDGAVSDKIGRVIAAKTALETARRDLLNVDASAKRLSDEQARIRENLKAVADKSDASTLYTKKILEIEDAIAKNESSRSKAKEAVDQRESSLRSVIRSL